MTLKIISAEKILFEGEATMVTLPGEKGRFTVLPHHASLISTLMPGKIVYRIDGNDQAIDIDGGIADVDRDVVSVCIY
jgi:F-type H+-transporting ATPase subunit epsilon